MQAVPGNERDGQIEEHEPAAGGADAVEAGREGVGPAMQRRKWADGVEQRGEDNDQPEDAYTAGPDGDGVGREHEGYDPCVAPDFGMCERSPIVGRIRAEDGRDNEVDEGDRLDGELGGGAVVEL